MKYLKIYEEFGTFHLDQISRKEFNQMNDRAQNDPKYREGYIDADITHTQNEFIGNVTAVNVDRYKNTNYKVRRLIFDFEEHQKEYFYRFEESDFEQICNNPQILLDYLKID